MKTVERFWKAFPILWYSFGKAEEDQEGMMNVKAFQPLSGERWLALVLCVHTACASFPVLLAHGEDLLHPIIHGFGKPAELLTLLFPVTPQKGTDQIRCRTWQELNSGYSNSHFMEAQVWSFRLYRGEDHHAHRLILLRFSLSRLPVLSGSLGFTCYINLPIHL